MKVLIVDDQYANRYLLEKLMTGYGFTVITAEDGVDALEKVKNDGIDLIISDILLPRMDGFQFCKEIKSNSKYNHIPFVFYTAAYTEKKDQDLAESLGADRYILKPTDPKDFITIIRELINEYPQLSEETPKINMLEEEQYLSEHNSRLIRQLEKKLEELKDLNKAIRISETRYKNLFENANDAIILYELSYSGEPEQIVEVNKVACTLLGYSHEEMIGKKISEIETTQTKVCQSAILSDLGTFGHLTYEGEYLTKARLVIPVEVSAHLFYENEKRFCLSICRDITARKKAMAELSRAVLQINSNIHQMATIGDKIRNPLAIILTLCEECPGGKFEEIAGGIQAIDACIDELDMGWVESEKIRAYLQREYGIGAGNYIDDEIS